MFDQKNPSASKGNQVCPTPDPRYTLSHNNLIDTNLNMSVLLRFFVLAYFIFILSKKMNIFKIIFSRVHS